jgi:5-methylthioribose kinase
MITKEYQHYLIATIEEIWQTFVAEFSELMQTQTQDISLQHADYQCYFLSSLWQDTLGYAGTELIRRTIGLAHVKDLDTIVDDKKRAACESNVLQLGQTLLLHADTLSLADVLIEMDKYANEK